MAKFFAVVTFLVTCLGVYLGVTPEIAMHQLEVWKLTGERYVEEAQVRRVEEENRLERARVTRAIQERELAQIRATAAREIQRIRAEENLASQEIALIQRQLQNEHDAREAEQERKSQGRETAGKFLRDVVKSAEEHCRRNDC